MNLSSDFWFSIVTVPFVINLLTTVIGIVITVFWVDRKIQEREEKRWLPSKNLLYAKLVHLVTGFMREAIPYALWKRSRTVYCFGSIRAMAGIEFQNNNIFEMDTRIYQTIKNEGHFDLQAFSKYQNDFENILDSYAHLMEPELFGDLLKLEEDLTSLSRNTVDWKNEAEIKLFSLSLRGALINASQIGQWLESHASQRISSEKFIQELKEKNEELKKEVREIKNAGES